MLKVLIVEDDLMIADSAEDIIAENEDQVCGIARTVEAVAHARLHKPDLALVDLRLGKDALGTKVAAHLVPRGKLSILYAPGNTPKWSFLSPTAMPAFPSPIAPPTCYEASRSCTRSCTTARRFRRFRGDYRHCIRPLRKCRQ